MRNGILVALSLIACGAFASPQAEVARTVAALGTQDLVQPYAGTHKFTVGDTCSYSLDMSLGQGTMTMTVKAATDTQLTLDQDINIAGQAQSCESVSDLTTGKITSLTCNGQAQTVPDSSIKVNSTAQETCTVPAGTFACMHINATDSQNETLDQWVNPNLIPVSGMIKSVSPSQFGTVTIELTSFKSGS